MRTSAALDSCMYHVGAVSSIIVVCANAVCKVM